MQDKNGIFYYPYPHNKRIRMYVRDENGTVEFRMANADHPEIWERHGWLDMDLIKRGAEKFKAERDPKTDPTAIYDLQTATYLLKEATKK